MNVRDVTIRMASCPYAGRVRALAAGDLRDDLVPHVEEHLTGCSTCGELLDALDDASDPVIQELSSLPAAAEDEPEFRRLEARLMNGFSAQTGGLASRLEKRLADPAIGPLPQQLGNYELVECIGRGAWGAVFRARHTKLEQTVAVKVLDAQRLQSTLVIDRFVQELKAVGQLRHANIVQATDAGEDRGFHYLVTEYIDGIDTARLLAHTGPLAIADACEIVRQAAAALDFAHGRGWVHRDVKPSNLMITRDGTVKLLDLGIAGRRDEGDGNAAAAQVPLGTADYMAPEQWTHFADVDARADVYSLGSTLFKLLTAHVPHEGKAEGPPTGKSENGATEDTAAPSATRHRPEVRRALGRFIQRMLARRPENRIATAAEVAEALTAWSRRADLPRLVRAACGEDATGEPVRSRMAEGSTHRRLGRRAVLGSAVAVAGTALFAPWLLPKSPGLRLAQWRPLSPVPPTVLLAMDAPEQVRVLVGDKSQIAVESQNLVLVHLGRAVSGVFALRVALRQETPGGGVGVFFQYRRADEFPVLCDFQSLELRTSPDSATLESRLLWSRCTAAVENNQLVVRREPWAETEVELGEDGGERLQVVLGRSGFPELEWNGRTLEKSAWTLSTEGHRHASLAPDRVHRQYLGSLGLVSLGGRTTFVSPQLAYL
jgi:tRNA A-37 threonylcarbamoyl transferase component Bud32